MYGESGLVGGQTLTSMELVFKSILRYLQSDWCGATKMPLYMCDLHCSFSYAVCIPYMYLNKISMYLYGYLKLVVATPHTSTNICTYSSSQKKNVPYLYT